MRALRARHATQSVVEDRPTLRVRRSREEVVGAVVLRTDLSRQRMRTRLKSSGGVVVIGRWIECVVGRAGVEAHVVRRRKLMVRSGGVEEALSYRRRDDEIASRTARE